MDTRNYDRRMAAKKRSYTGLVVGGAIVAVVLAALVYSVGMGPHPAANPPAVLTSPAPATGMPAPRETTTGQTLPRPNGE